MGGGVGWLRGRRGGRAGRSAFDPAVGSKETVFSLSFAECLRQVVSAYFCLLISFFHSKSLSRDHLRCGNDPAGFVS